MQRIFISVDISEDAKKLAGEHISKLKELGIEVRVGWIKPEKMHLTLRFLGDIDEKRLAKVNNAVARVANLTSSFQLTLKHTGAFPNKKRPKVLWLGIQDDEGNLQNLFNELNKELEGVGFEGEDRKFRPHLTIARLREPNRSRELAHRHIALDFEPVEFEVSAITVYESRLGPDGSKYFKNLVAGFRD